MGAISACSSLYLAVAETQKLAEKSRKKRSGSRSEPGKIEELGNYVNYNSKGAFTFATKWF